MKIIVERVGSNAYNQPGRIREIVGIIEAASLAAASSQEYPSLPGTMDATTALRLDDGRTEHCYHNQRFEYRSFLRANRADRGRALGWPALS